MEKNINDYIEQANLHYNNKHFKVCINVDNARFFFEEKDDKYYDIPSSEKEIIEEIYNKKEDQNVVYYEENSLLTLKKGSLANKVFTANYTALQKIVRLNKKINAFFHRFFDRFNSNLCQNAPWLISSNYTTNLEDLEVEIMDTKEFVKKHGHVGGFYNTIENRVVFNGSQDILDKFDHELGHVVVLPKGKKAKKSSIDEGIQEIIRAESFGAKHSIYNFPSALAKILTEITGNSRMKTIYKNRKMDFEDSLAFELSRIKGDRKSAIDYLNYINEYHSHKKEFKEKGIANDYAKNIGIRTLDYYFTYLDKKYSIITQKEKEKSISDIMFGLSRVENTIIEMTNRLDRNIDVEANTIPETFNNYKEAYFKKIAKQNNIRYLELVQKYNEKQNEHKLKVDAYKYFRTRDNEELAPFTAYYIEEFIVNDEDIKEVVCEKVDKYAYPSDYNKNYKVSYSLYHTNRYEMETEEYDLTTRNDDYELDKNELPRQGNFRKLSYKLNGMGIVTDAKIITDKETVKGNKANQEITDYVYKSEVETLNSKKK